MQRLTESRGLLDSAAMKGIAEAAAAQLARCASNAVSNARRGAPGVGDRTSNPFAESAPTSEGGSGWAS